jgi:hypothetical protein
VESKDHVARSSSQRVGLSRDLDFATCANLCATLS